MYEGYQIVAQFGKFDICRRGEFGRHIMYYDGREVARINSSTDPRQVYDSYRGWIEHVSLRTERRLDKIHQQIVDLEVEKQRLELLVTRAKLVVDNSDR